MGYYEAMKKLFPLEIDGDFDADLAIEGALLDTAKAQVSKVLVEAFPDTAVDTIDRWERMLGIVPISTDTIAYRRARVMAKWQEKGSLSRQYYIDIAAALGYTVTIAETGPMFRAGISKAGDAIYYARDQYVWIVDVGMHPAERTNDALLEARIRELAPAWTEVLFDWNGWWER